MKYWECYECSPKPCKLSLDDPNRPMKCPFGDVEDGFKPDWKLYTEKAPVDHKLKPCCKATFSLVLEYTLSKVERCSVCGTPV